MGTDRKCNRLTESSAVNSMEVHRSHKGTQRTKACLWVSGLALHRRWWSETYDGILVNSGPTWRRQERVTIQWLRDIFALVSGERKKLTKKLSKSCDLTLVRGGVRKRTWALEANWPGFGSWLCHFPAMENLGKCEPLWNLFSQIQNWDSWNHTGCSKSRFAVCMEIIR